MGQNFCDILLTGTMADIGVIVRRSLESHGLSVVSMEIAQNTYRDEFGYHRALKKLLAELTPSMIIPIGDSLALARAQGFIPEGTAVATGTEEQVRELSGKVSFSRLASRMGIVQPRLFDSVGQTGLPTAEQAARMHPDQGAQIIFKRDISFGGHGVHRPRSIEALQQLIDHQSPGEPYLIEEWIPGQDFSVDAVRFGRYFRASSYRVLQNVGGAGPSVEREVLHFPALEETARRIMDSVGFIGLCGFDFRIDPEGNAFILECNPRFTGGIQSQINAGFDIPYILFEHREEFLQQSLSRVWISE